MTNEELNKVIRLFQRLYIDEPIHVGSDLLSPELGQLWAWDDSGIRMAGFLFIADRVNLGVFYIPSSSLFNKGLTPWQLALICDTFEAGIEIKK